MNQKDSINDQSESIKRSLPPTREPRVILPIPKPQPKE